MNFYRIFGIDEPQQFDDPKDKSGTYYLMMQSFARIEPERIVEFRDACVLAFGELEDRARKRMQGAISEALLNCFNHAFSQDADFQVYGRRAWLAGHVNPERREMAVMIFDQGAGIPRALTSTLAEIILSVVPGIEITSDSGR